MTLEEAFDAATTTPSKEEEIITQSMEAAYHADTLMAAAGIVPRFAELVSYWARAYREREAGAALLWVTNWEQAVNTENSAQEALITMMSYANEAADKSASLQLHS